MPKVQEENERDRKKKEGNNRIRRNRLRYVKVTDLEDLYGLSGYYDPQRKTVFVDFSHGMTKAIIVSFHEVLHIILSIPDLSYWFDVFWGLFTPSLYKDVKLAKACWKAIFERFNSL
jgi:hypothetical protein